MDQILLTQDLAMKFLVWAVYYKGLELTPQTRFASLLDTDARAMFSLEECEKLDKLNAALFRCFDSQAIASASEQMHKAKALHEPCPYTEESLDMIFRSPK